MAVVRKTFIASTLIAMLAFTWLWWSRPVKSDMASYVPADALLYIESNSMTDVARGLTSTNAWRDASDAAGVEADIGMKSWLTDFFAITGIGPAEAVIISRSQAAVALLGFEAEEEAGDTLKFRPRVALILETHTSAWRVRPVVEERLNRFARRVYGSPKVERKEIDGVPLVIWSEEESSKRRLISAVSESVIIIGNDEEAVKACLDARNGSRASLMGNEQLRQMRGRLGAEGAIAFGFMPKGSGARIVEALAPAFVGGVSEDAKVQSLLATMLPRLIERLVEHGGWSARAVEGRIEDRYFISIPSDAAATLQAPFTTFPPRTDALAGMLPHDARQFSLYTFRSPEVAWRGLNAALSAQSDVTQAAIITLALDAILKPYGIERPRDFLRAVGSEVATARLHPTSERKVLIAEALDRESLEKQVRKHLGSDARAERIGGAELLVSDDEAASFVDGYLILGEADDVRACLRARGSGRTLRDSDAFRSVSEPILGENQFARTFSIEHEPTIDFIRLLLDAAHSAKKPEGVAVERLLSRHGYAYTETRLASDGFEKRTLSPFGLFGDMARRFQPQK